MIEFKCEHCDTLLRLDDSLAGRDGWCRSCKRMVVVPKGGLSIRVADLPHVEAVDRLQRLLRYAATKADLYKQHLGEGTGMRGGDAARASSDQQTRQELAVQRTRGASLEAALEESQTALHRAELQLAALESSLASERETRLRLEQEGNSRDAALRSEIAALESSLASERETRLRLEQEGKSGDAALRSEIAALESSRASERETRLRLEQEGRSGDAALRSEIAALEADLASERAARTSLEQEATGGDSELLKQIAALEAALGSEKAARTELERLENDRAATLEEAEARQRVLQEQVSALELELVELWSRLAQSEVNDPGAPEPADSRSVPSEAGDSAAASSEGDLQLLQQRLRESQADCERLKRNLDEFLSGSSDIARRPGGPKPKDSGPASDRQRGEPDEVRNGNNAVFAVEERAHCAEGARSATLSHEPGGGSNRQLQVVDHVVPEKAAHVMKRETFLERWHREAEVEGAQKAQFRLGVRYETGLGVARDDTEAFRWFSRAAERGHAGAQYHLGRMYAEGRGVARDITVALGWYRKAADQEDAGALCELGLLCLSGTGVSRDIAGAVSWFRRAANRGNARAFYHLGLVYGEEGDVFGDPVKAFEAFSQAAEMGHPDAQFRAGRILLEGIGVARDVCHAVEWFRKASEQGHAEAQYALAKCLQQGQGTVQNYVRAYAWYNLAAVRLDQARVARDQLGSTLLPEQLVQGQQLAEEMHARMASGQAASV